MIRIAGTVTVRVPVEGETVEMICRRPSAAELSGFLNARFETKGKKVRSHLYEARAAFIDTILVDVKGAEYENAFSEAKALCASTSLTDDEKSYWSGVLKVNVTGWKDLIPMSWKSSAAMSFEDAQPDEGEEDSGGN